MAYEFCPECSIGLNNQEVNLRFCQNCKAHWDEPTKKSNPYLKKNRKNKIMKSGIQLITIERQEQIKKHGRTIESDVSFNTENQLLSAMMMIASNIGFKRAGLESMPKDAFEDMRPEGWGRELCWKMLDKDEIGQLEILGAFAAAEIDRLLNSKNLK